MAASLNDVHSLDYFIRKMPKGSSVDLESGDGWTPAHLAGFMGNFDSLNLLIENGADPWRRHHHKMTVFDEIIRNDNKDLLSAVYDLSKSKPRDSNEEEAFSLLHLAAGSDSQKCLEYLLQKGDPPNQVCNFHDKATPLHFAVLAANYVTAKLLLKYGAAVSATDSHGNTPYHFAVTSKSNQLLRLLEEAGGDASKENEDGMSPIDVAHSENIKSAKIFFSSLQRYSTYLKENSY
jgi:ankyrin repeat protein